MKKSTRLSGKRVLVIGLGISGRSAAEFLIYHGALVHAVDRNAEQLVTKSEIISLSKQGLSIEKDNLDCDLSRFDMAILSPGIPQTHPLVNLIKKRNIPLIGEIELGCQFVQNQMVGITGTNGKTTVTLLIAHVLNSCGYSTQALGNVEIPLTKQLLNISSSEFIALELSSYQLETLSQSCLDIGLLLNLSWDHLERYETMENYAKAKFAMARCIKSQGSFYVEEKAWLQYSHLCEEKNIRTYGYSPTSFIYTDLDFVFKNNKREFQLPITLRNKKSHDLENFLAAYAICSERGVMGVEFLKAWETFKKPPHRLENVLEYKGVKYVNDSKGTNIDAVIRAVQAIDGPIILIAGGVDKGAAYTPWLEEFKNRIQLICAIGQAAVKIKEQLNAYFPVEIFSSLENAVKRASQFSQNGYTVLLSPGCSSFDMFKNYAHRGEEFVRIVRELERG